MSSMTPLTYTAYGSKPLIPERRSRSLRLSRVRVKCAPYAREARYLWDHIPVSMASSHLQHLQCTLNMNIADI